MSETTNNTPNTNAPMPGRMRKQFFKRRRSCPFSGSSGTQVVDYKNIQLLQKFLSDTGKILPSRITAVSTKHQRHLSRAIKRARFLALIPYIAD